MSNNPLILDWQGPYSLVPRNYLTPIYQFAEADKPGLYLWTIPKDGRYLINYVGIAKKSISHRQIVHLHNYLSGKYVIYDPTEFIKGIKKKIYSPKDGIGSFLEHWSHVSSLLMKLLQSFDIFIAPITIDSKKLEYIESAIIKSLQNSEDNSVSGFLDNSRISRKLSGDDSILITMNNPVEFAGLQNHALYL